MSYVGDDLNPIDPACIDYGPIPTHWRWRCHCGRLLATTAVKQETVRDDGAYYGIRDVTTATCSRCGPIDEPQWVPMRWKEPAE